MIFSSPLGGVTVWKNLRLQWSWQRKLTLQTFQPSWTQVRAISQVCPILSQVKIICKYKWEYEEKKQQNKQTRNCLKLFDCRVMFAFCSCRGRSVGFETLHREDTTKWGLQRTPCNKSLTWAVVVLRGTSGLTTLLGTTPSHERDLLQGDSANFTWSYSLVPSSDSHPSLVLFLHQQSLQVNHQWRIDCKSGSPARSMRWLQISLRNLTMRRRERMGRERSLLSKSEALPNSIQLF